MKAAQLTLLLLLTYFLQGQQAKKTDTAYYRFALSNSQTAKPFGKLSSLVYKDFHPGVELAYGRSKTKNNHQWLRELVLNYLFHRWVQHNLSLSVNGGYRYFQTSSWGAKVMLGAGVQGSMPTEKVFDISGNGIKEGQHIVRPQFVASFSVGLDKKINDRGMTIFLQYQQKVQTPFIKEYVPLLPYNTLMLGIGLPVR